MPKLVTNKPKAKSAKLRSARAGAQPAQRVYRTPTAAPEHESMLLGLTDPFSAESANARYPDQGAGKTLTWVQRFSVSMPTDANGNAAITLSPKNDFPFLFGAPTAGGGQVTWAVTFSPFGSMSTALMNVHGKAFRPTSFGIRIANTLSATQSSGRLVIAKAGPAPIGSTTDVQPNKFSSWDLHPMLHGGEWHAVGNPRSADAYNFVILNGTNVGEGLAEWENIYIFLLGSQASTNAVYLEMKFNYEYTVAEDSIINQLALPQPTFSAPMISAINEVQSSHPPSHKGASGVIKGFIKKEGLKALKKHVLPFVEKKAVMALAAI